MYRNNDTKQFQIVLSDAEEAQMQLIINQSGMKKKNWFRHAVLEKMERELEKARETGEIQP